MAFLLLPAAGRADHVPVWLPARPHGTDSSALDLQLLLRAREALQQDPSLATYRLGVSVRDLIATLWGNVPSDMVSRRARDCLKHVPGLSEVKVQLHVEPEKTSVDVSRLPPLKERLPLAEPIEPAPLRSQRAMACSPWTPRREPLDHTEDAPPPTPRIHSLTSTTPPHTAFSSSDPVLPPLRVPAAPTTWKGAATIDLTRAVEGLQRSEGRFQRLNARVQDGVVSLGGTVSSWDDLYAFARRASRLPGVERVRLEDVHTDPAP